LQNAKNAFFCANMGDKNMMVGTIFIQGLSMIKVQINLEKMRIIEFEKKSFFDIVNIIKKKK